VGRFDTGADDILLKESVVNHLNRVNTHSLSPDYIDIVFAKGGHLDIIIYARKRGCDWTD
jgi:hypothetical protein